MFKRIRLIALVGVLCIITLLCWLPSLFNTTRNFRKLQELAGHSKLIQEVTWDNSAYRRNAVFEVYVLATQYDLRFYPNEYVVITRFKNGNTTVELISGSGPGGVTRLSGQDALNYLDAVNLNLLQ